jgi:hypothetical protein
MSRESNKNFMHMSNACKPRHCTSDHGVTKKFGNRDASRAGVAVVVRLNITRCYGAHHDNINLNISVCACTCTLPLVWMISICSASAHSSRKISAS